MENNKGYTQKDVEEFDKKEQQKFEELKKNNSFLRVPSRKDFKDLKREGQRVIALPVDKYYIDSNNVTDFVRFFNNIESAKDYYKQMVIFTISGYDDDLRELYEIEEVINWVRKLMFECPQLIYFANMNSSWSFIKTSIAKEISVISSTGEKMLPKEAAYRKANGLPVTKFQIGVTIEGHVAKNIVSMTKRLGARIGDIKGATELANSFINGFDEE